MFLEPFRIATENDGESSWDEPREIESVNGNRSGLRRSSLRE